MTDMPERIWAWDNMLFGPAWVGKWGAHPVPQEVAEYTRADLVPAMLAAERAAGRREGLEAAIRARVAMIGGDDDRSRRTDHHHDPRTVGSTDRHDDSETVR